MYIVAVLAAIIASISPFWGLIFIISFCGKYLNKRNLLLLIFACAAVILFAVKSIDITKFADVIFGVGLAAFLYFLIFTKTLNYLYSILAAYVINLIYAVIRHFLLGNILKANIAHLMEIYKQFISSSMQDKPENLQMALALINSTEEIFAKFYIGIWIVSMTFAVYFGTMLLSRKTMIKWQHRKIGMPFFFIYLLIIALVLFLLPNMKTTGINALAILAPIFLIQGISILDFYWGDFFKRSRFLLFLLIISMVFNYFILILVALIGLLDIWFDFRKIRTMEEIHENHSN
ncbi:MAG: DUF2232 domain-containing protein [Candidatus Cloacimonadales bacterium]|nr:DUF2232 domain-containing protein [Candidatus Cloacimonadales bacterium]